MAGGAQSAAPLPADAQRPPPALGLLHRAATITPAGGRTGCIAGVSPSCEDRAVVNVPALHNQAVIVQQNVDAHGHSEWSRSQGRTAAWFTGGAEVARDAHVQVDR